MVWCVCARTQKTCRNFIWIFCLFVWKRNAVGVVTNATTMVNTIWYGALVEMEHGCCDWAILQVNFQQVGKKRCFCSRYRIFFCGFIEAGNLTAKNGPLTIEWIQKHEMIGWSWINYGYVEVWMCVYWMTDSSTRDVHRTTAAVSTSRNVFVCLFVRHSDDIIFNINSYGLGRQTDTTSLL